MTKRILKEFKLTEISAVDKPAQAPAVATIMKRNDDAITKRYLLTTGNIGHSHLLYMDKWDTVNGGGETSWTEGHDHPFVINEDGSITIGEALGHTHEISTNVSDIIKNGLSEDMVTEVLALTKSSFDKPNSAELGGSKPAHKEELHMPDISKAEHQTALDQITSLKKSLAIAVALGAMNDLTKSHYQTLSEADQTAFISKSTAEQDEVITKALEANAVIFTSADGTEFRKSDDPRMVAMAKRADEADAALAKSQEQAADLAIEKRATSEFSNLPGEVASQVALLKAVAGIENKESREAVEGILKSHNANLSSVTMTLGSSEVNKAAGNAGAELDNLAKAHVAANPTVTYLDAYDVVANANPELYNKAVAG